MAKTTKTPTAPANQEIITRDKEVITPGDAGAMPANLTVAPSVLTAAPLSEGAAAFLDEVKGDNPQPAKMSIIEIDHKAAAFVLPGGEIVEEISGYVIHYFQTRQWYKAAFKSGTTGVAPDCWSGDLLRPSSSSLDKQSEACFDCPLAQFGTGRDGRSQACGVYTWLFLLNPSWGSPPMACLKMPPSSIRNILGTRFKPGYLSQCVARHKVYQIVWTTFRLRRAGEIHCVLEPVMGPAATDPEETRQIASLRNAFFQIMEEMRGPVSGMDDEQGGEG